MDMERNSLFALDNCDKRSESEQLLMFQVANWLKDSIKLNSFSTIT